MEVEMPDWESVFYCAYYLLPDERDCESCALTSYGLDCHNNPVHRHNQTVAVHQE